MQHQSLSLRGTSSSVHRISLSSKIVIYMNTQNAFTKSKYKSRHVAYRSKMLMNKERKMKQIKQHDLLDNRLYRASTRNRFELRAL